MSLSFLGLIALFAYVVSIVRRLDAREEITARTIDLLKRRIEQLERQQPPLANRHEPIEPSPRRGSIVEEQEAAEERAAAARRVAQGIASTPVPPTPALEPVASAATSPTSAPLPSRERPNERDLPPLAAKGTGDVETFFGGRVLLVGGIIVALLGVGFFLHLAIQRGWLGPEARLGLTIAAGIAAMLGGEHLRRRGFTHYGSALTGGGIGALFLASHFAANVYGFITPSSGFVAGGIVAAFSAWFGVNRRDPFLVHLGFFGAWLAPYVFGKETSSILPLVSWLIAVDLGVLLVRARLQYSLLDLMAACASLLYVGGWVMRHPSPSDLGGTVILAYLAMLARHANAILPVFVTRVGPDACAILACMVGSLLTVSIGGTLLFPANRELAAAILAGFAGIHFAAARIAALRMTEVPSARRAFTAFGLFFLAVAIPQGFREDHIGVAYAACGGAFAVLGCQLGNRLLRNAGLGFILFAALAIVASADLIGSPDVIPILNVRFFSQITPSIAAFLAADAMRRTATPDDRSRIRPGFVAIAGYYFFARIAAAEAMEFMAHHPDALGFLTGDDGAMLASFTLALVTLGSIATFRRWMPPLLFSPAFTFAPAILLALPVITEAHLADFHPLVNASCLYGLLLSATMFAAASLTRSPLTAILRGLAILFAIITLTFDLYYLGMYGAFLELTRSDLEFFAQVAISVLWAVCAICLLKVGFAKSSKALRTSGLALFAITLCKVFLSDLERLDLAWRAASFLGLGVLLVLGSYLYQRKDDGSDRETNPAG